MKRRSRTKYFSTMVYVRIRNFRVPRFYYLFFSQTKITHTKHLFRIFPIRLCLRSLESGFESHTIRVPVFSHFFRNSFGHFTPIRRGLPEILFSSHTEVVKHDRRYLFDSVVLFTTPEQAVSVGKVKCFNIYLYNFFALISTITSNRFFYDFQTDRTHHTSKFITLSSCDFCQNPKTNQWKSRKISPVSNHANR